MNTQFERIRNYAIRVRTRCLGILMGGVRKKMRSMWIKPDFGPGFKPRPSEYTAIAQWLRCCATNRKVAGSIPAGASGFFIDKKSFRSHYGPGVDSTSNRNEYHFLGVKAAGV